MNILPQDPIFGTDASREWLDMYRLPKGQRARYPNTDASPKRLAELARRSGAVVCFAATGGREWRLWSVLDSAGIVARQLPPAQMKAFAASRGKRAKTDRVDAELIARYYAFRPDAGHVLSAQKLRFLRALTSKRDQLVGKRKRLLAQIKAPHKQGVDEPFQEMDTALRLLLDTQAIELESQIECLIAADAALAETAKILRSVPGIGPATSTMLIAEMPELGQISGEQAAALTRLAPIAHDSGALRGRRAIGGGRHLLRHVLLEAALVASHHNPAFKSFADRPPAAGKPHKVIITAVARKPVTIVNALCKSRRNLAEPAI